VQVVAVVGVGDVLTGVERLEQRLERLDRPDQRAGQRGDVVQARRIEQRLVVALGEPVAAGVSIRLQLEQAARRLVLQPFPRVPLVDPRGVGELRSGKRAVVGERPVQTEDVAEVDGEEIERADRVHEQALDERVTSFRGIGRGCHSENLLQVPACSEIFLRTGS
jgi:hypothetical protein